MGEEERVRGGWAGPALESGGLRPEGRPRTAAPPTHTQPHRCREVRAGRWSPPAWDGPGWHVSRGGLCPLRLLFSLL